MKLERRAALATTIIFAAIALLALAGCGGGGGLDPGKTSYNINSPWHGQLQGIAALPTQGDVNVPTDADIHIYWPDANYAPPAEFTFRLEKEENPNDWGGVHTKVMTSDSNPAGGSWWFDPVSSFSPYTRYRIIITDTAYPSEQAIIVFETGSGPEGVNYMNGSLAMTSGTSGKAPVSYKPKSSGNAQPVLGEDAIDHVIKTGK